jgi:feruloyl-CoA synthase
MIIGTRVAQHKKVDLLAPRCAVETRADGVLLVRCKEQLGRYPEFLTDRLEHWAASTPDRLAFAQRAADGTWRRLTYAQLLQSVQAVGEALVARGLCAGRPVAILSENDLEQAIMVLACQYVGVPVSPVSPAYSLMSRDYDRLRHVIDVVKPGLIFVNDASRFRSALQALPPGDRDIVCTDGSPLLPDATAFAELLRTEFGPAGAAARAARRPEDTAKILFTSGSTGVPKGVINTHRMIAANQQMIAQVYRFVQSQPPVILDWLPWHHTFGGNHNFGMTVYNGGSFYIDDGRPTPAGIVKTVRNLMDVAPTAYFNVPRGYADLLPHLDADPGFAARFFGNLNFLFYSGASLDQKLWDALNASSIKATGTCVPILTSLGSTETAPASISSTHNATGPGEIGLPIPGVEAKLVPLGEKLELRLRGPHVMPGYHCQPASTASCFDEEGFYIIGDAVKFVDPTDPDRGLAFDGRIAEDFKLDTGTWVNVAAVKARLIVAFAPYARDVVVIGADRAALAALLIPDLSHIRKAFGDSADNPLCSASLHATLQSLLDSLPGKGSSERVERIGILTDELSIDRGEMTDKGSINARKVIAHRPELVGQLYAQVDSNGPFLVRKTS